MKLKHFVTIRITSLSKKEASFDCLLFLRSLSVFRCSIFNYPNTFKGWSFERVKRFVDNTPGCSMMIIENSDTETAAHMKSTAKIADFGLVPYSVKWGETYQGDPAQFRTREDMQAYLGTTFDGNMSAIRLIDTEASHDALLNSVPPEKSQELPKFQIGGVTNSGAESITGAKISITIAGQELKGVDNACIGKSKEHKIKLRYFKDQVENSDGQPQTYAGHVITPQFIKGVRDFYADMKKEPRSSAVNINHFTPDMLTAIPHDVIMKYIRIKESERAAEEKEPEPTIYKDRTKKKQTADVQQMSLFGM